jgi:sugar/nucleoside kinase (ribokinase family)
VILVFGLICVDRVMRIDAMPGIGGFTEIRSEETFLGGEAANTANALSTWGVPVELHGNPIGCDLDGDWLESQLQKRGLRVPNRIAAQTTPVCQVFVDRESNRTMFGKGFGHHPPLEELDAIPFRKGDWFTADPNLEDLARDVVRRAEAAGMHLYLMDFFRTDDVIPAGSIWQSSTDWVGEVGNGKRNLAWVRNWTQTHGCTTILTDGARGLYAMRPGGVATFYEPFEAETMIDSTGAGDMFRAAMIWRLSVGDAFEEALSFASAAGALKCGYLGATSYVPTEVEIRALMNA